MIYKLRNIEFEMISSCSVDGRRVLEFVAEAELAGGLLDPVGSVADLRFAVRQPVVD